MADHTAVNLKRDVEDSAAKFGFAPDMEARFGSRALGLERSAFSYQRLAPGFRQPFGHRHREQEEVYVVLSGTGRAKLDDQFVELEAFDALRVPPATTRCFEAGSEGLELLAIGAPSLGDPAKDAEPIPGWWAD